jgi:hypothetical protein
METLLANAVAALQSLPAPKDMAEIIRLARAITGLARAAKALMALEPKPAVRSDTPSAPKPLPLAPARPATDLLGVPMTEAKTTRPGQTKNPRPFGPGV